MTWFNYQSFYNQIAARLDMVRLVEVGCYRGDSITHLAKKLVELGRTFELWGVDIWKETDIYADYVRSLTQSGVREHVADIHMPSTEAIKNFDDRSLDFVFIDADHRPDAVLADIKAWAPKVRPEGILAGHDYYWTTIGYKWGESDNVSEAVNEAVKQKIIPVPHVNRNTSVWSVTV